MKIDKYLKYCSTKAASLSKQEYKHRLWAAIVDKKGNIIGEGPNSFVKSSPYQKMIASKVGKTKCEYLHAEIQAITRAVRNKSKAQPYAIFIARVGRSGNVALAAPCEICKSAIEYSGIKHTFYTI